MHLMKRAFVLSRPADFGMARRCAERLLSQGWSALVVIDPREWETRPRGALHANYSTMGRGMFGNACAASIISAIWNNSNPGDVVAKFDCDIRLTAKGNDWLNGATETARAFRLGNDPWGGCWSAPHNALLPAATLIQDGRQCKCPESALCLSAFRHTCGLEITGDPAVKWNGGEHPQDAGCLTLPIGGKITRPREELGAALFDLRD